MSSTNVYYIIANSFPLLHIKSELKWLRPKQLKFEANKYFSYIHLYRTANHAKPASGNVDTFSSFGGQLAS